MTQNQLRQSSLILGTGPGALTVLQDGSTVIIPGIDAWYVTRKFPMVPKIPDDVKIHDALLEKNLGVQYFVVPPAQGISEESDSDYLHASLFPSWLVCYTCNSLMKVNEPNRIKCPQCSKLGKVSKKMVQTNFVIACEDGHLDEFPWNEWVHRGVRNICANPELIFKAKGIVQLSSQMIICTSCNKRRDLAGTSTSSEDGSTELSKMLEPGSVFFCNGSKPWLRQTHTPCSKNVRMVLRSSNNIYFANTVSSILVPSHLGRHSEALERIESSNQKGKYLAWLLKNSYNYKHVAMAIKVNESDHYEGITEEDLASALSELYSQENHQPRENLENVDAFDRTPEWIALSNPREDKGMVVRKVSDFDGKPFGIDLIHAVPSLKKTTALKGFTRLKPRDISPAHGRQLMRREPFGANANWLPAIQQSGEGIFVTLSANNVQEWIDMPEVRERANTILSNLKKNDREIPGVAVSAKFILLHSLAHVLIQELVIECGYTSASLAERIYADGEQCGILIYTASASSDGTMGGLVEMSHPDRLLNALMNGLERARWCSNDPVCMELGNVGQGNSGSNLAACHSCCLLPETACEHFNQGLDRAMLIGDVTGKSNLTGFFDHQSA
jgi:hypothetical protein